MTKTTSVGPVASGTLQTQSIYVDKSATGSGIGVDWTNAFTTIQAAVNSLPAIINHAVTIYIRKGSTAYDEVITLQRVVAAGSITIRGEYYWTGTVATGGTGKFTLNSSDPHYADRAQIAAGDKVILMAYSGTVEGSAPSASYIDTVASISGAEVTLTTNTTLSTTTSFTYQIIKTQIQCTTAATYALTLTSTSKATIIGLQITSSVYRAAYITDCRNLLIYSCYFDKQPQFLFSTFGMVYRSYFGHTSDSGLVVNSLSNIRLYYSIFGGGASIGVYCINSYVLAQNIHIQPSCTTGMQAALLGVIYRASILNNGATPISPASNPGTDGAYII